jgi:hypothetical protein
MGSCQAINDDRVVVLNVDRTWSLTRCRFGWCVCRVLLRFERPGIRLGACPFGGL